MRREGWKSISGEIAVSLKRWSRDAAMVAGGQIVSARWVDEQHKEKSRYVVKDFANTRDPTMFAAACDNCSGKSG